MINLIFTQLARETAMRIGLLLSASAAAAFDNDDWQAKFQSTYVWQRKPAFHSPYSGINSLRGDTETSYTFSATAYLGLRLWEGAEVYANPEVAQGKPLSELVGLGGISNGEAQKAGDTNPSLYRARLFLRQTINFDGERQTVAEDFNQLATTVSKRRLVFTLGDFALNDFLDANLYAHDPRRQFLNWALMDYGAWDFAADARGFTRGIAVEYDDGDWALRFARALLPSEPNGKHLNAKIFDSHGDNIEIEHSHVLFNEPGKVRLLLFRNAAVMGSYHAANQLAAVAEQVPDITEVRVGRAKLGGGISLEQAITDSLGVFARLSAANDNGEEYAFAEIDRSVSVGASIKGSAWQREDDVVGVGFARNDLNSAHRHYLEQGGAGFFLGDGALRNYHTENIFETYYSVGLTRWLWTTLDYQHIVAPAFNADRGPVNMYTARVHVEF